MCRSPHSFFHRLGYAGMCAILASILSLLGACGGDEADSRTSASEETETLPAEAIPAQAANTGALASDEDASRAASADAPGSSHALVFRRVRESREGAFTLLVPKGWKTEGGIFRVDPTTAGGPSQSIAAKCDFAVKRDAPGTVMMRWLPEVLYFDARRSPAGQMGLFPPGSNYAGMTVWPLLSAAEFITKIAFPYAHPEARQIEVVESRALHELAGSYLRRVRSFPIQMTFSYDAAAVTLRYVEGGIRYRERLVTVIENWGEMGAGMWGNKETLCLRAPEVEFDAVLPLLSVIQGSVQLDRAWLSRELRGQIERGEIALRTQQEVQRIDREIVRHRATTNEEIHRDVFLTLTDQEDYVNPHTGEVERGSNQWAHRWINDQGDVIYTDNEDYDPNSDVRLHLTGFQRSPIRPRG